MSTVPYIFHAFNILEDCRGENLFVAQYRPTRKYFVQLVADYILKPLKDGEASKEAVAAMSWLYLYGRKFLPKGVVNAAYASHTDFLAKHALNIDPDHAAALVDEYITCTLPRDADKAFDCIVKFASYYAQCLTALTGTPDPDSPFGQAGGEHSEIRKGSPSASGQKEAAQRLGDLEDLDDDDLEDGDSEGGGDSDSDSDWSNINDSHDTEIGRAHV